MYPFDEVRDFWKQNTTPEATPLPLSKENVEAVIRSRIKKVKKSIAEYFWLSLTYQILIYSFACHLFIKFWGDTRIMIMCAVGALLYIPFTIILMRKFKRMFKPVVEATEDIRANVRYQYELLTRFFKFKKRFDRAGIPISCLILEGILFTLYAPGGIEAHVPGSILAYLGMLLIFSTAAWFENKKHFVRPLRRFKFILEDIEKID
jgi:hypothetical protein